MRFYPTDGSSGWLTAMRSASRVKVWIKKRVGNVPTRKILTRHGEDIGGLPSFAIRHGP